MANIIVPSRRIWTRQPQQPVEIDRSNPITRGLVHAWVLNQRGNMALLDSCGNANGVFGTGSPTPTGNYWVVGPGGHELMFDNSGTGTTASTRLAVGDASGSGGPGGNQFSLLFDVVVSSFSAAGGIYGSSGNGISVDTTTGGVVRLLKEASALIGSWSTPLIAGNRYRLGVSYDGTTARFYSQGKQDGSASNSQSFSTAVQYYLGWCVASNVYLPNNSILGRFLVFNRALSSTEFAEDFKNPWQIFRPQTRRSFFDIGAGGGSTLNASAAGAALVSGSATLAAQVALAGVGVAIAGGSAAASVAVPLSAAGLAVAGGSGDASATVTIAAAGLAQAAGAAGLSASVLLAGAGAAQAAGNAELAAQLEALAAGAAQASGSANLSGGAPGNLSASGGDVASGLAVLSVTVALQAAGAAQASGSASGSAGAPGDISASGGAQGSGSAIASATVTLTVAGFVQAMGSGQMAVQVSLAAYAQAVSSGSASISQAGVTVLLPAGGAYLPRRGLLCGVRPSNLSAGRRPRY